MIGKLSKHDKSLKEVLLKKSFKSEHLPFVTNRQVHHWKEIGVLNDHRKYAASGMKSSYDFLEVLWIRIITEMRTFRISNISIKEVKKHLFDIEEEITNETTLFYQAIEEVISKNEKRIVIVLKDGSIKILDKESYLQSINTGTVNHHFALQLDILIWEMLSILDFDSDIKFIIQQYKNTDNE